MARTVSSKAQRRQSKQPIGGFSPSLRAEVDEDRLFSSMLHWFVYAGKAALIIGALLSSLTLFTDVLVKLFWSGAPYEAAVALWVSLCVLACVGAVAFILEAAE